MQNLIDLGDLRTRTDAKNIDAPYISKNALHSLFSECIVSVTVLEFPTPTENLRTNHSFKQNFYREKLQKTHGCCVRDIITRMSQLKLMESLVARTT